MWIKKAMDLGVWPFNNLTKQRRSNFISSPCCTLWSHNAVIVLSSLPSRSDWLLFKGLLAHESWLKHLPWNVLRLLQFVPIHNLLLTHPRLCVFPHPPSHFIRVCVCVRERESTWAEVHVSECVRVWGIGVGAEAEGILHNPLCIIVIRFPRIAQLSHTAPGTQWFVVWHSLTRGPVC